MMTNLLQLLKNQVHIRQCHGCRQSFSSDELGFDESTKEFYCLHCNHYRYADVDDTPKTCHVCSTLCDPLDLGQYQNGLRICGKCWVHVLEK